MVSCMVGWMVGCMVGWVVGTLGKINTTSWPILQADICHIFIKTETLQDRPSVAINEFPEIKCRYSPKKECIFTGPSIFLQFESLSITGFLLKLNLCYWKRGRNK